MIKQAAYKHGYLFITAAWLYTISFIFTNYFTYSASPQKVQQTLEKHLVSQEISIDYLAKDTTTLQALLSDKPNKQKEALLQNSVGIFIYESRGDDSYTMLYWNSFAMSVSQFDLQTPDSTKVVKYRNGTFELRKHSFSFADKQYLLAALIPIHWDYFIENTYLQNTFAGYPNIGKLYGVSNQADGLPINNVSGDAVYYIQQKDQVSFDQPDGFSFTLRLIAMLFLVAFINVIAHEVTIQKGVRKGFVFLLVTIFILRFITYSYPLPFAFRKLELFDPAIYASSALHPSLGDLLINCFILLWLIFFLKTHFLPNVEKFTKTIAVRYKYIVAGSLAIFVWLTFQLVTLIVSLVVDSKISLDVTNFFSLNEYTLVCFVILSFIILAYYYLTQILVAPWFKQIIGLGYRIAIVIAVGLFLITFHFGTLPVNESLAVLGWLLLYLILIEYTKSNAQTSLLRSSYFLFWTLFFSLSVTWVVQVHNGQIEIQGRERVAEKLALQTDASGEQLMNFSIAAINNDNFLVTNFERFKKEETNKFIKDSLIAANFSGYLNKYDTRIYMYDKYFTPLYNDDSTSYPVIDVIVDKQGKATSIENLYYYENATELFSYIYRKALVDTANNTVGYFVFIARPKRYKSDALYPELLRQSKDLSADLNTSYAYAIYNNGKLLNSYNDYFFNSQLTIRQQLLASDMEMRKVNGASELWYKVNNKMVVVVKKEAPFVEMLTFCAYLFCVLLAVVMLASWFLFLLGIRFRWNGLRQFFHFNLRTQIHATIILISAFSFIIIGVATISFFIVRYDRNNEERLTKTIRLMAAEIGKAGYGKIDYSRAQLNTTLTDITEVHNVDANMYNTTGDLIYSSQPNMYDQRIISSKMEPKAFYELHYAQLIQYVQKEHVGNFSYLSIYVPVKDESGNVYAYLNIPYLNSQSELDQEISTFLVTLINLIALIFLVAGAVGLIITHRITAPLLMISNRMKEVNLGTANEEIVWQRHDEIGTLINEYNKMVQKLSESAKTLARSEREGAWREMARQVAHEIKNPLTPMKLSIQYMQKAVNENAPNVKELSQRVANTLIEQIEQLAQIANDFSQFANIANVRVESFDVTELLQSLVQLNSADDNVMITFEKDIDPAFIKADRSQINRLFTNLIKNAIEASVAEKKAIINIRQYAQEQQLIVSITDNGTGIPQGMRTKMFTPNFTTKTSGTGLGLAICKGIVENMNGRIYFTTEEGKGTTFFVEVPLHK